MRLDNGPVFERSLSWLAVFALLASAVTLAWAARSAQVELPRIAIVPGAPLDAVVPKTAQPEVASEAAPWTVPPEGHTVDFARFGFDDYDPPELRGTGSEALAPDDFPEAVRVLHGADVRVAGYPLVVGLHERRVTEVLLTRFPPGCCFGSRPVFDEWIQVTLAEPLEPRDVPPSAVAFGRLDVGEELDEEGFPTSLYRMTGAKLEDR